MPDLEKVNIARKSLGLEPLEKLANETPAPEENKNPENPGVPNPENKENPTPPPVVGELTNEQLVELLGKRGITVSSLDDLKPKDPQKTPQELADEEEAEKLAFGLTKGLFKKSDYESFITDNHSQVELVFANFEAEAKADDPTLTPEEIREEFEAKYGLNAEVGTRQHKRGAKELAVIAKELLKSKHSKIYEAENKFAGHKATANSQAEYNRNIIAKTPQYKADVEEAFSSAKKIAEGIEIPEESVTEIKNLFLESKFVEAQIKNGFTKEQIAHQVKAAVYSKNMEFILKRNADLAVDAHKAGAKGIVPIGTERKEQDTNKKQLTPAQQQEYDRYLAAQPKPASALN
jgi:hypothetical protein